MTYIVDFQKIENRIFRRLKSPKSPDWKKQTGKQRRSEERANLCAVNSLPEAKKSFVMKLQQETLPAASFAGLSSLYKRLRRRREMWANTFIEWVREHDGALAPTEFPDRQNVAQTRIAWGLLNAELKRRNIKVVAWCYEEQVTQIEDRICL